MLVITKCPSTNQAFDYLETSFNLKLIHGQSLGNKAPILLL